MEEMGMTNKQFQGFVRLTLSMLNKAIEATPDNTVLLELRDTFQAMLLNTKYTKKECKPC